MNCAIILAGGIGERMGTQIPKQFIKVNNKPIIVYAMENFEKHPLIDLIEVVCLKGYEEFIWNYAKEYNITKLKYVTIGGDNCQDSTRNGLYNLENICKNDDIILISMSSYPLMSSEIITDCIEVAKKYGNAVSASSAILDIFYTDDNISSEKYIERDKMKVITAPTAFKFEEVLQMYKLAYKEKKCIKGNVYAPNIYIEYGKKIYFSKSERTNIKITNKEDLILMEMYLEFINGGKKYE